MKTQDYLTQMGLIELEATEKKVTSGGCGYCLPGSYTCAQVDELACLNGIDYLSASTILFYAALNSCWAPK